MLKTFFISGDLPLLEWIDRHDETFQHKIRLVEMLFVMRMLCLMDIRDISV